ncbi:uncharacterized protein LOC121423307 isoform X2 [Lytechinus variegatus]|uniref:uncharacterized protein LOC121423307 isoform X2 n=1 Tax=Lytechinus variegatus TaxID=7654 RepID=UPI001BB16299|nr:uncharacterized protein LOC121423307 isoform X2 [Lytechinus variegatus]
MAVSSYLMLFAVIYSIVSTSSLKTKKDEVIRIKSNPYTDFKRKDDINLEDEVIDIALGDQRTEVWSEIVMTPELKANKMSLNKKHKPAKERKMKLHGKKGRPLDKKQKETPFEKYLPRRNSKV